MKRPENQPIKKEETDEFPSFESPVPLEERELKSAKKIMKKIQNLKEGVEEDLGYIKRRQWNPVTNEGSWGKVRKWPSTIEKMEKLISELSESQKKQKAAQELEQLKNTLQYTFTEIAYQREKAKQPRVKLKQVEWGRLSVYPTYQGKKREELKKQVTQEAQQHPEKAAELMRKLSEAKEFVDVLTAEPFYSEGTDKIVATWLEKRKGWVEKLEEFKETSHWQQEWAQLIAESKEYDEHIQQQQNVKKRLELTPQYLISPEGLPRPSQSHSPSSTPSDQLPQIIPPASESATSSQPLTPSEPELPLTSGWSTQKKVGIGAGTLAAIVTAITGGYLYKNAPKWRKERVKKALKEHGKELSDISDANLAFLTAASYAKFNPARLARALLFKRAVVAMPVDQELSKDLWPVLYQLYYEKKPSRSEKRALKKIYKEGREQARAVTL